MLCDDATANLIGLSFKMDFENSRPEYIGRIVHSARISILGQLWGEFVAWQIMPDGADNLVLVEFFPENAGDGWPADLVADFFDEVELSVATEGMHFTRIYSDP